MDTHQDIVIFLNERRIPFDNGYTSNAQCKLVSLDVSGAHVLIGLQKVHYFFPLHSIDVVRYL